MQVLLTTTVSPPVCQNCSSRLSPLTVRTRLLWRKFFGQKKELDRKPGLCAFPPLLFLFLGRGDPGSLHSAWTNNRYSLARIAKLVRTKIVVYLKATMPVRLDYSSPLLNDMH